MIARWVTRHGPINCLAAVVLLWIWALPALVLWNLAASRDLVLPYLPRIVWGLSGWLWGFSPVLWCACLGSASIAAYVLSDRFLAGRPRVLITIWVLTIILGMIHLLWGSALIHASAG